MYKRTKINFAKVISKNSKVSNNVKIGPGTVVLDGSIINFNTIIGSNCLINNSVSINHDNIIKDFASLGPGVITGGNVEVGFNSHIGIGTVLKNNVSIDENTVVGGGSYVNKNCKNFIYYGVPAIPIRKRKSLKNITKNNFKTLNSCLICDEIGNEYFKKSFQILNLKYFFKLLWK